MKDGEVGERELAKAVGAIISAKRKQLGLSQENLAEKVNIRQESLSKMEKGMIAPKFERLQAFADALECKVEDLFKFSPRSSADHAESIADIMCNLPEEKRGLVVKIVADLVQALR